MLYSLSILLVFGLLGTHQNVRATTQCNFYNFGTQALLPCGLSWWQSNNFEENTADLNPQLTDLVSMALQSFGVNTSSVAADLRRGLQVSSDDPLRKLVETAALGEPYMLYAVLDAADGFGLTKANMRKMGLPESLAEEGNMKKLYQNYFSKSCKADILQSLISCVQRLADEACEEEDKVSVIIDILTKLAGYYCTNQTPKQELMSVFNGDFGEVYADFVRFLGVVKDPDSPYLFNLSPASIFMNQTAAQEIGQVYLTTCGYLIESFSGGSRVGGDDPFADDSSGSPGGGAPASASELLLMFSPTSELSVGAGTERLLTVQAQFTNCALRAWNNYKPEFFTEHEKMFNHLKLLNERYGGPKLSLAEPERGDVRHTVMVYGDPHMKAYKIPGTLTCPALGTQTYLSNGYFKLVGTAEPACDSPACSTATYVTSVKINFPGQAISYQTGKVGEMPSVELSSDDMTQTFTEKGGLKLEVLGSSVRITDENSAAVVLFSKFRETYQIAVRMSESVLDNSLGLLIVGCPNPTDIKATTSARRRRDTQCETVCMDVEGEFRETCVFDCDTTGDLEVANITKNVMVMETFAVEKDEELFKLYPTTTTTTTTATKTTESEKDGHDDHDGHGGHDGHDGHDGGTGNGNMYLPSIMVIALLALLSHFM